MATMAKNVTTHRVFNIPEIEGITASGVSLQSNAVYRFLFIEDSMGANEHGNELIGYVCNMTPVRKGKNITDISIEIDWVIDVETQTTTLNPSGSCVFNLSDVEDIEKQFITMVDVLSSTPIYTPDPAECLSWNFFQIDLSNDRTTNARQGVYSYELLHFFCQNKHNKAYQVNGYIDHYDAATNAFVINTFYISKGKIEIGTASVALDDITNIKRREIKISEFNEDIATGILNKDGTPKVVPTPETAPAEKATPPREDGPKEEGVSKEEAETAPKEETSPSDAVSTAPKVKNKPSKSKK